MADEFSEALPEDGTDPLALLREWLALARKAEPVNPDAMSLATVGSDGMPHVRYLLLKEVTACGLCFYTGRNSAKGQHLLARPRAAAALYWRQLGRQARCAGTVRELPGEKVERYFASRARASQLGAWASNQSNILPALSVLRDRLAAAEKKFAGREVAMPPDWTGFCLQPLVVEFWQEGPGRLHERVQHSRIAEEEPWTARRLFP